MTNMRMTIVAVSVMTTLGLVACSDGSDESIDSLPMLTAVASTTVPSAVADATTTTTPGLDDEFYLVQQGDSLSAIAGSFGVKVDALMAANGITNPDKIQAGQKLIIPSGGAPTTTTTTVATGLTTTPAP